MRRSLLGVVAMVLAAAPSAGGAGAVSQRAGATITVWEDLNSIPAVDGLTALADRWGAANGLSVKFVTFGQPGGTNCIPCQFPPKAKSKDGPDIIYFPEDEQGGYAVAKLIAPRPAGVLSASDLARYQPFAQAATLVDGVPYSIPHDEDGLLLFYNKRLVHDPPATWTQLIASASRLTKGNQSGFLYWISGGLYYNYWAYGGYGAYVFGSKGGKVDIRDIGLDNAAAVQALTFIRSLTAIVPKSVDYSFVSQAFQAGRAAMILDGPWNLDSYAGSLGPDLGAADIPALPGGYVSRPFVGIRVWAVNRYSAHQAAAWDLARYLSLNGQAITARYEDRLPTLRVAPGFTPNALQLAAERQFSAGILMPNSPAMSQVWDPEYNAINLVLQGKASPRQALKTAVQKIKKSYATCRCLGR